jgi:hypothetical protein
MTHKTSARLLLNLLAATFLVGTLAGQAQAETVWRFPPKGGAPYAVPHEHSVRVAPHQNTRKTVHTAKRAHGAGAASVVR